MSDNTADTADIAASIASGTAASIAAVHAPAIAAAASIASGIAVIRFAVGHKITHPEFGEATVFAVRPQIVHGVPSVRYGVEFANGGAWDITGKGWIRVTD